MVSTIEALTVAEFAELKEREAKIENGLKAFYEVGQELIVIRDRKLYRQTHKTFEDYFQERWQMTRARAYQLMAASEVVESLSTMVDAPKPASERQTRPLNGLSPNQQQQVWAAATATTTKPTAAHVADTVRRLTKPNPLQVSQPATVIDESSPYHGQAVMVRKVEGAIVHCELQTGEPYPFLVSELRSDAQTPLPEQPKPEPVKPKLTLDLAKVLLHRVLDEVDPQHIPQALYLELQAVL